MSASEKLRALGEASRPHVDAVVAEQEKKLTRYVRERTGRDDLTVTAGSPMLTVARALPAIIAVVEAAEESVEYDSDYADVNDPNPVAAALATLSQALEETP